MNHRSLTIACVSLAFLLLLLYPSASDCGSLSINIGKVFEANHEDGPPAHAPAHGHRGKYNYRYYPSAQVYFDVSRGCYFYLRDGGWEMSMSLPLSMRVRLGDHVSIAMDTDRPYTQFAVHKKQYPPGQLKVKKQGKKKKW